MYNINTKLVSTMIGDRFDAEVDRKDLCVLEKLLVPEGGGDKAPTVYGEVIRAIGRVFYRYFNDGDYFHCGYGIETSASAMSYLVSKIPKVKELVDSVFKNAYTYSISDGTYEYFLAEVIHCILNEGIAESLYDKGLSTDDSSEFELCWDIDEPEEDDEEDGLHTSPDEYRRLEI